MIETIAEWQQEALRIQGRWLNMIIAATEIEIVQSTLEGKIRYRCQLSGKARYRPKGQTWDANIRRTREIYFIPIACDKYDRQ
jgi:hypothetical protein